MTTPFLTTFGSSFNLLTTEMESLSSTGGSNIAVSSVGGTSGQFTPATAYGSYELCHLVWNGGNPGYGSAFTTGATLSGWFLEGTTGVFPSLTVAPNIAPDFSFSPPLSTLAATTNLICKRVILPSWPFYVMIQNNLGVTMSTGATTAPFLLCPTIHRGCRFLRRLLSFIAISALLWVN